MSRTHYDTNRKTGRQEEKTRGCERIWLLALFPYSQLFVLWLTPFILLLKLVNSAAWCYNRKCNILRWIGAGSAPSDMDPLSDGSYQAAFGESELAPEELPGSQHIEHFKTRKLEERVKQKITPRGLPSDFGMDPPALQPPAKPKMLSEIASKRTRETFDEETSILPEDLRPRNIQNTANTQSNGKLKNEVEKWQAELESLRSGKVPQTKEEKILMAAFIADQAFRAATGNLLSECEIGCCVK